MCVCVCVVVMGGGYMQHHTELLVMPVTTITLCVEGINVTDTNKIKIQLLSDLI